MNSSTSVISINKIRVFPYITVLRKHEFLYPKSEKSLISNLYFYLCVIGNARERVFVCFSREKYCTVLRWHSLFALYVRDTIIGYLKRSSIS